MDDTYIVGVVRNLKNTGNGLQWELYFINTAMEPVWLTALQLADALYIAAQLGVSGPSLIAPPFSEAETPVIAPLPASTSEHEPTPTAMVPEPRLHAMPVSETETPVIAPLLAPPALE